MPTALRTSQMLLATLFSAASLLAAELVKGESLPGDSGLTSFEPGLPPGMNSRVSSTFENNIDAAGSSLQLNQSTVTKPETLALQVLEESTALKDACEIRESRRRHSPGSSHLFFGIWCRGVRLEFAEIAVHVRDGVLVQLRSTLPGSGLDPDFLATASPDHFWPASSGAGEKILVEAQGLIVPAWRRRVVTALPGAQEALPQMVILDAKTGGEIWRENASFHAEQPVDGPNQSPPASQQLALVWPRSPYDQTLMHTVLPGVGNPTLEEGRPTLEGPDLRVRSELTGGFASLELSPETDGVAFDVVQTWWGATSTLAWFREKLGWQPEWTGGKMLIDIHASLSGNLNNAAFTAPSNDQPSPRIRIGRGDGQLMRDLARDRDVVTHELGHWMLWRSVKSPRGASGIWHEGTADYLVYAMNDDPHLARSIKVHEPWLRTALIPAERRMDDPRLPQAEHELGKIWAAMLWEIRRDVGPDFDLTVHHSADWLGERISLRDGVLALLQADQARTGGQAFCPVLTHAVRRGLATTVEHVNGSSCGLDLKGEAAASRAFVAEHTPPPKKSGNKTFAVSVAGRKCGSIGTPGPNPVPGLFTLLSPLFLIASFWRKKP